jgi:hypothetical protein
MSPTPFASAGTRGWSPDAKATRAPSALTDGWPVTPSDGWAPAESRDTIVTRPVRVSLRNTSTLDPLESLPTRFDADDANTTYRPSSDTPNGRGWSGGVSAIAALAATPDAEAETSVTRPVAISRMNSWVEG